MPLKEGAKAPEFLLKDPQGGFHKPLSEGKHILLVFYKVTCPTCQLTLPFVEKLFRAYGEKVGFFGVVQDPPQEAINFANQYGLTFTQLIDAPNYEISILYDVQVVPTIYLIDPEGSILFMEESFVKDRLEELNSKLSQITGFPLASLFEDVSVPAFKAG